MAKHHFHLHSVVPLEARAEELTDIILDQEGLKNWASNIYLHTEFLDPGRWDGLGKRARVRAKGWMPHSFAFIAEITEVDRHRAFTVETRGDLEGVAHMRLEPIAGREAFEAHLDWTVRVRHPVIRWLVWPLKPIFALNHRWATRVLGRQLQKEILRRRRGGNEPVAARATFPHNIAPAPEAWPERVHALNREG